MAQALVPLKDLVQAKTRLAGLLRPSERRALAQAMAEDVLEVLSGHRDISLVTLVSDDPGAHLLAARYGADCWSESELGCRGLNALVACAAQRLLQSGEQPLLVLHADLPLLAETDISRVLACQEERGGLVIGCDSAGTGTNLLAFDASSVPPFCFGQDSCARHRAAAGDRGIPARVLRSAGIGLDVDEPRDLACLLPALDRRSSGHTANLLVGTTLGERIRLALGSLEAVGGNAGELGKRNRK
jgi:2-phospho-L-lactate guanylyltransferase